MSYITLICGILLGFIASETVVQRPIPRELIESVQESFPKIYYGGYMDGFNDAIHDQDVELIMLKTNHIKKFIK